MAKRRLFVGLGAAITMIALLAPNLPASAVGSGGDALVSVGSPSTPFPRDKQNEPAVAVDAHRPNVLAAGANDEIDMEPCNVGDPTVCPFTPGVGVSGIYFSFNGGDSWTQPTYSGWTARHTDTENQGYFGPIGTLPKYYESGLSSDGDPALAFGPRLKNGEFSWANGSRLYYANLTANFSAVRSEQTFKGFEAIAVSRMDNPSPSRIQKKSSWFKPVIVSRQNTALFSDKEQIWADNAASSPFFGNVYLCNVAFRGQEIGNAVPEPVMLARSTDGGNSWTQRQISAAANSNANPGRQGCSVRTDSNGVVYVFWEGFDPRTKQSVQLMRRSFNGGRTFDHPQVVASVVDVGQFDGVRSYSFDGVAGARTDSFPSADIANGAPTGTNASNEIVMTWSDARNGLNHEQALVTYSTNRGATFSSPVNGAVNSDRPDFPAIAISPDGEDVYLIYDGFLDPWRNTTSTSRRMQGVIRHGDVAPSGQIAGWTTLHRGAIGDARASSANSLIDEFLGDYNYAVATNTYGAAVWNDTRRAAVCGAMNRYRQSIVDGNPIATPAPGSDCPATFGNTDIYGGSYADPTP